MHPSKHACFIQVIYNEPAGYVTSCSTHQSLGFFLNANCKKETDLKKVIHLLLYNNKSKNNVWV